MTLVIFLVFLFLAIFIKRFNGCPWHLRILVFSLKGFTWKERNNKKINFYSSSYCANCLICIYIYKCKSNIVCLFVPDVQARRYPLASSCTRPASCSVPPLYRRQRTRQSCFVVLSAVASLLPPLRALRLRISQWISLSSALFSP